MVITKDTVIGDILDTDFDVDTEVDTEVDVDDHRLHHFS